MFTLPTEHIDKQEEILPAEIIEEQQMSVQKFTSLFSSFSKSTFEKYKRNINVVINVNDAIETIKAENKKIFDVMNQILMNIIKYAPEGQATLNVYPKGKELVFQVVDMGLGISDQEKEEMIENGRLFAGLADNPDLDQKEAQFTFTLPVE
jgi:signal transduction histidine kinase